MTPRVTIIGPFTFYKLTKGIDHEQKQHYIQQLVMVYKELLQSLEASGATSIQLEEPSLTKDLTSEDIALVQHFYHQILKGLTVETICATYFEALSDYQTMINLPVDGFGLDFVHGKNENLAALKKFGFPKDKVLFAGIINGRDIWRAELQKQLELVAEIRSYVPFSPIHLQTSCSLQHVPVTTAGENGIVPELLNALAFANEKITELQMIKGKILQQEVLHIQAFLDSEKAIRTLALHESRQKKAVHAQVNALTPEAFKRTDDYDKRSKLQRALYQTIRQQQSGVSRNPHKLRKTVVYGEKGKLQQPSMKHSTRTKPHVGLPFRSNLALMSLFMVNSSELTWSNFLVKN